MASSDFNRWKTKYDVKEWYVYRVQERYKKLCEEQEKEWQQCVVHARGDELYFGNYFYNLPYEYENRDIADAMRILFPNDTGSPLMGERIASS